MGIHDSYVRRRCPGGRWGRWRLWCQSKSGHLLRLELTAGLQPRGTVPTPLCTRLSALHCPSTRDIWMDELAASVFAAATVWAEPPFWVRQQASWMRTTGAMWAHAASWRGHLLDTIKKTRALAGSWERFWLQLAAWAGA